MREAELARAQAELPDAQTALEEAQAALDADPENQDLITARDNAQANVDALTAIRGRPLNNRMGSRLNNGGSCSFFTKKEPKKF